MPNLWTRKQQNAGVIYLGAVDLELGMVVIKLLDDCPLISEAPFHLIVHFCWRCQPQLFLVELVCVVVLVYAANDWQVCASQRALSVQVARD